VCNEKASANVTENSKPTEDAKSEVVAAAAAPVLKLTIAAAHAGRADRALAAAYPEVGRRRLSELFAQGGVRIGKRTVKKGDRLDAGTVVELAIVPAGRGDERPQPDPAAAARLQILLERPELIAISKPAPMPSQPLRSGELGSAANGIAARYPECAALGDDPRDGGVVHRLDIGTTGVLLFARTQAAYRSLREAFSDGLVLKTYLAVTVGRPVGTSCSVSLAQRGKRAIADEQDGLNAHTDVDVLASTGEVSLVRCTAQTGRMHQVRAHLAMLRSPILGDVMYGAAPVASLATALPEGRFFLHAESVALPFGKEKLAIRAPLPEDLTAVLTAAGLKHP
jgi:23S rRNA pseudouridine1911/1915/1917 synthase